MLWSLDEEFSILTYGMTTGGSLWPFPLTAWILSWYSLPGSRPWRRKTGSEPSTFSTGTGKKGRLIVPLYEIPAADSNASRRKCCCRPPLSPGWQITSNPPVLWLSTWQSWGGSGVPEMETVLKKVFPHTLCWPCLSVAGSKMPIKSKTLWKGMGLNENSTWL